MTIDDAKEDGRKGESQQTKSALAMCIDVDPSFHSCIRQRSVLSSVHASESSKMLCSASIGKVASDLVVVQLQFELKCFVIPIAMHKENEMTC